jgi:hypothetical protein
MYTNDGQMYPLDVKRVGTVSKLCGKDGQSYPHDGQMYPCGAKRMDNRIHVV